MPRPQRPGFFVPSTLENVKRLSAACQPLRQRLQQVRRWQTSERRGSRRRLAIELCEPRRLMVFNDWLLSTGGSWNVAGNWSQGVPTSTHDVRIPDLAGSQIITVPSGSQAAKSITSAEALMLAGGTLTISGTVEVTPGVTMAGGILASATVSSTTQIIGSRLGGQLTNVKALGGISLNVEDNSNLTINGGLLVNGTVLIGNSGGANSGNLIFGSSSTAAGTVTGNAIITFGANQSNQIRNGSNLVGAAGTLTFDTGITITGQVGKIDNQWINGTVLNKGKIDVNLANSNIVISNSRASGFFNNTGTINVSDGIFEMGSFSTLTGLGLINRTGGAVRLSGEVDLQNSTWNMSLTTGGNWQLYGGTFRNGIINQSSSGRLVGTSQRGTLDRITIASGGLDLSRFNNARINIENSISVNGDILIGDSSGSIYGELYFGTGTTAAGALTGNANVIFGASTLNKIRNNSNQTGPTGTFTIGADVTIRGQNGTIDADRANGSLINRGTVIADSSTESIIIGASTQTNPFTNAGTINLSGGEVFLRAAMILSDFGTIDRTGGTLTLGGVLDLRGSTWIIDTPLGSWNVKGATIQNGSIDQRNGAKLIFTATDSKFQNIATVNGGLDLTQFFGSRLEVVGSLAVSGTILLGGAKHNDLWSIGIRRL